MEKTFKIHYGEVTVRNAMFENDSTNIVEGIEISVDGLDTIEVYGYFDLDNMTRSELLTIIDKHSDWGVNKYSDRQFAVYDFIKEWVYSDVKFDDVTPEEHNEDGNNYDYADGEYCALTEDEADEKASEYIKDYLWSFNADFILEHSILPQDNEGSLKAIKAIQEQYEDGNDGYWFYLKILMCS